MQINRNSDESVRGPSEWFTGAVFIDTLATPSGPSRLGAASVHFAPGARTAWHTHPFGQTIYVTEGVGLCQRHGGPIEVIRPGDRVFSPCEADDQGSPVTWGEHLTDEEYGAAPSVERTRAGRAERPRMPGTAA